MPRGFRHAVIFDDSLNLLWRSSVHEAHLDHRFNRSVKSSAGGPATCARSYHVARPRSSVLSDPRPLEALPVRVCEDQRYLLIGCKIGECEQPEDATADSGMDAWVRKHFGLQLSLRPRTPEGLFAVS